LWKRSGKRRDGVGVDADGVAEVENVKGGVERETEGYSSCDDVNEGGSEGDSAGGALRKKKKKKKD
jgi:hypothetical protein